MVVGNEAPKQLELDLDNEPFMGIPRNSEGFCNAVPMFN